MKTLLLGWPPSSVIASARFAQEHFDGLVQDCSNSSKGVISTREQYSSAMRRQVTHICVDEQRHH